MRFDPAFFAQLVAQSVREPRVAAARLIGFGVPLPLLWQAAAAVAASSAVLSWLANAMFPVQISAPWMALTDSPLRMALAQMASIALVAGAMSGLGQVFGGKGRFAQALVLAVWIEVVLLCVQAAQVVLMLLFPLFASALGMAAFVLFLVMLTQFTAALHGFTRSLFVFLGIVATLFIAALLAAIVLGMFGLVPTTGA
ncbi:MAG: YIP1 family protein [Rhodobacteraceae bacterium]|nr:YIP1 family protein [Paracoccaceae bacterium]